MPIDYPPYIVAEIRIFSRPDITHSFRTDKRYEVWKMIEGWHSRFGSTSAERRYVLIKGAMPSTLHPQRSYYTLKDWFKNETVIEYQSEEDFLAEHFELMI